MTQQSALTFFAFAVALSACSAQTITLAEGSGGEGALPGGNGGSAGAGSYAGQGGAPQSIGGSAGTGVGGGGFAGTGGYAGSYAGAQGGSAGGEFCTPSSGCGGSMYCEPDGCGSLAGNCQPLQTTCDGSFEPSCGCDGLTYWNSCVRAWAGVGEQYPGTCDPGLAEPCDESQPCSEPFATCLSMEPTCQTAECWVLPCPAGPPELRLSSCNGSPDCQDACSVTPGTLVVFDGACQ
ncbi:MAG: hypothetical protein H6716_05825 [Polyangiaceae bacterium]|nr:hypothetical protein [Polyangiaceae bacterium]